jgi:hypothetical protein
MTRASRKLRRGAMLALLLALACLALAPAAEAKPRPLYWGAWIGDQLTGEEPPWDMGALSSFESRIHKGLSMLEFSAPFSDCSARPCAPYPFPTAPMESIRNYGAIPLLSWNSGVTGRESSSRHQLAEINSGRYDSYIREFAEAARAWGHPFFLRFDWEMNGNWFPWSQGVDGNSAGQFVPAWRRVHDIFDQVGATNATWVWCPYADAQNRLTPMRRYYPGDSYVDWTCLDGFNWGMNNKVNPLPWRSFDQLFRGSYEQIVKQIAPDKPMLLGEMASSGGGSLKAKWIRDMFKQLATRYQRVRGLIWFNQVDRGVQWPLETSPASSRAFSRGIRSYLFRENAFQSISSRPIQPPS